MNSDGDENPFADPSIRQATAQTLFVVLFIYLSYLKIKIILVQINRHLMNTIHLQIQP